jgi:peptidoglycan/LPS O-acetylase OafA/YrhL
LLWVATLSPTIVFAGAGISLNQRVARPALLLGALSYPIYILHYPVFCWVNGIYQVVMKRPDALIESILLFVAVPVAGFIALQVFDEPVRRALNVRFSQRRQEA